MNKSSLALNVGILALGVGVGWLAKPDREIEKQAATADSQQGSTEQDSRADYKGDMSSRATRSSARSTAKRGTDQRIDQQDQMMLDYEKRQEKLLAKLKKQKIDDIDNRIDKLTDELGLTDAEATKLKSLLLGDLDRVETLSTDMMGGNFNPELVDELANVTQPGLVNKRMAELLEGESKEKFLEKASKERTKSLESSALGDLAKMQGLLNLDEDQKDAIYDKLYDERASKYDQPDAGAAMSYAVSEMSGGAGANFLGDEAIEVMGLMMNPELTGQLGEGENPSQDAIRTVIDERINQAVDRFDDVLRDEQKESYRQDLERRYQPLLNGMFFGGG